MWSNPPINCLVNHSRKYFGSEIEFHEGHNYKPWTLGLGLRPQLELLLLLVLLLLHLAKA